MNNTTRAASCQAIPKMFTTVKYQCSALVLCLFICIARKPPIAPPKKEKSNKVFSGIRLAPCFAFFLSEAYKAKVIMLITTKNANAIKNEIIIFSLCIIITNYEVERAYDVFCLRSKYIRRRFIHNAISIIAIHDAFSVNSRTKCNSLVRHPEPVEGSPNQTLLLIKLIHSVETFRLRST